MDLSSLMMLIIAAKITTVAENDVYLPDMSVSSEHSFRNGGSSSVDGSIIL
jgi:hypothetical protein